MDSVLYNAVYRFFVVSNTYVDNSLFLERVIIFTILHNIKYLRFDKKGNHNIIMVFKYGSFIRLCVFILFRSS